jgi:hypothetical protein
VLQPSQETTPNWRTPHPFALFSGNAACYKLQDKAGFVEYRQGAVPRRREPTGGIHDGLLDSWLIEAGADLSTQPTEEGEPLTKEHNLALEVL